MIISLGINVSLIAIQRFYVPVFVFSLDQTEEYEEAIAQLDNTSVRFRNSIIVKQVFVYGEPDIFMHVREIRVRRSDFDLLLSHNYVRALNAVIMINEEAEQPINDND